MVLFGLPSSAEGIVVDDGLNFSSSTSAGTLVENELSVMREWCPMHSEMTLQSV